MGIFKERVQEMLSDEPLMRRLSSLPEPKPNHNHKFQMDKVAQQANILKQSLIVAGRKVRERILREMREIKSSMHFLPQKISGDDVHENYRPNELEYYSQNLILVDNDNDDSLVNLVQPRPGKRPERPPLPVRKEDYSEYFQYFTVKTPEEKAPSGAEDSDERIISSSLVRETSSVRR